MYMKKFIKWFFGIIIALIVLILIVAAILPKDFHAEGTTTINKPNKVVFDYVKHLKNQENYGVWFRLEDNIKKNYQGTDGTVGFIYIWKGDKVGEGKQVITKIEEGKRIDMDLFFNNDPNAANSYISTEEISPNKTKVNWVIDGKIPYPFNIMSLFYDMNKDFVQGTANLKEVLEKE